MKRSARTHRPGRSRARSLAFALPAVALLLGTPGCRLMGPRTIDVGLVHYNEVIQRTSNEQLLLNLVRMRYSDTPLFLEVASISTSFEFTSEGSLGIALNPSAYALGGTVSLAEQPTVTYTPLQGEQFVTSLLTPLDLGELVLLYNSGWAVDRVFRVCVVELNDVRNAPSASGPTPLQVPEYEEFLRVVQGLRALQQDGAISLSKIDRGDGVEIVLRLEPHAVGSPEHRQFAERLRLDPALDSYRLVPDTGARRPDQIVVATRSLMAGFFYVSQGVEVPSEDEEAGRVRVTRHDDGRRFDWKPLTGELFQVHHSRAEPSDASVRTHYRDRWFYVDDADLQSEATFALLTQLFSLQSGGVARNAPILTLPVGR